MSQNKGGGELRKARNVSRERGARFFVRLDADLVYQARLQKDVTQTRAAADCDIDLRTYKRAEGGLTIDAETARSIGDYYGREYAEFLRKSEQAKARSESDDERQNLQALSSNERLIDEEQLGEHRGTGLPGLFNDDERRSFSVLGVSGLDAISDFAYDNGFVLFSEQGR
jgi:hypothetical protein